jgi:PAS domain-containing protein
MTEPYALSRLLLRLPAGPRAATVAALYAAFGAVWIAVGDALVFEATSSPGVLGALQSGKGMLFVCLTTALVYLAARRFFLALARRARAERQRAEEVRALLAALPDLAFRLDGAGRVAEHLPTAGPQPAFPPEAYLGKPVVDFLPLDAAASVQVAVDAALQGQQPTEVAYALEVAEQLRYYEARVRPLGEGACGALALIRDITRQRQAEAQRELADLVFQHSTNGLVITA